MQSIGTRVIAFLERDRPLAPFQRRFVRGAFSEGVYEALLSGPRALGKSSLAGELLATALHPDGPLFVPGGESVLLASSLEQARLPFGFLRSFIGEDPRFRWLDSGQRVKATYKPTNTSVRVASSDARRAFGLGANAPLIIGDEPGAWQDRGGEMMYSALSTSGGKAGSLVIYLGTRAPGSSGGWWRDLVDVGDGSESTYRQVHDAPLDEHGEVEGWQRWPTIARANPLVGLNPHLGPKLKDELAKALRSDVSRRRFITYRLNRPVQAAAEVLFTVEAWKRIEAREIGSDMGAPICGLDVGSVRSWSTCVALYPSGRLDCRIVAPGLPNLDEQERRDSVPRGLYRQLAQDGVLSQDEGRREVRPEALVDRALEFKPRVLIADEFRLPAVRDALRGRCAVRFRRRRWSESTADICAARALGHDGVLSVVPTARNAFRAALSEVLVQNDDDGNVRLTKARNYKSRDDVASSLVLACGGHSRLGPVQAPRLHIVRRSA